MVALWIPIESPYLVLGYTHKVHLIVWVQFWYGNTSIATSWGIEDIDAPVLS